LAKKDFWLHKQEKKVTGRHASQTATDLFKTCLENCIIRAKCWDPSIFSPGVRMDTKRNKYICKILNFLFEEEKGLYTYNMDP